MVMKSKTTGLRVAAVIFAIVAIVHLVRLLFGIPITVGSTPIAMQVSAWAFLISAILGGWMWWLSNRS